MYIRLLVKTIYTLLVFVNLFYLSICVGNDLIGENLLKKIHASSCLSGEEGELISWKVASHWAKNVMKF